MKIYAIVNVLTDLTEVIKMHYLTKEKAEDHLNYFKDLNKYDDLKIKEFEVIE